MTDSNTEIFKARVKAFEPENIILDVVLDEATKVCQPRRFKLDAFLSLNLIVGELILLVFDNDPPKFIGPERATEDFSSIFDGLCYFNPVDNSFMIPKSN